MQDSSDKWGYSNIWYGYDKEDDIVMMNIEYGLFGDCEWRGDRRGERKERGVTQIQNKKQVRPCKKRKLYHYFLPLTVCEVLV